MRNLVGICELCGATASKPAMPRHLQTCIPRSSGEGPQELIQLRIEGTERWMFWLDLDVKAETKLLQLDRFLRKTWLECCGHLSAFTIGHSRYSVWIDDDFGPEANERLMNIRLDKAIGPLETAFSYEYDFGSTTDLKLRVMRRHSGRPRRSAVRLLARNTEPIWSCSVCGAQATQVCAYCGDDENPFACERHASRHVCGEEEGWLPVVNSPRMGVCGYTGPFGQS